MQYPDKLIRGIQNLSYMEDEYPNANLFSEFKENPARNDDYKEISINWYDDDGAMQTIFEQKKRDTDEYQFKVGGAVLSKQELDRLTKKPQIKNKLAYERREENGNKYHGNILMKKDTSKGIKNMIVSSLALCVESVCLREKSSDV